MRKSVTIAGMTTMPIALYSWRTLAVVIILWLLAFGLWWLRLKARDSVVKDVVNNVPKHVAKECLEFMKDDECKGQKK